MSACDKIDIPNTIKDRIDKPQVKQIQVFFDLQF
jgi:hypothetical protein